MEEENDVAEVMSSDNAPPAEVPAEAPEEPPVESMEPPPTPMPPKTVRIRKPRPRPAASQVVVPEIDDRFWASLLRTQRDAEHATRLQRLSEFSLI